MEGRVLAMIQAEGGGGMGGFRWLELDFLESSRGVCQ